MKQIDIDRARRAYASAEFQPSREEYVVGLVAQLAERMREQDASASATTIETLAVELAAILGVDASQ